jgi:hypothetical protein
MMNLRKPFWMRWPALLAAALFLLAALRGRLNVCDEGYAAYHAWRVHEGAVPYRDFWFYYAPGNSYLQSGGFSLLGCRLLSLRLVDSFFRLALALTAGLWARRLGAGNWAWLPFALTLAALGALGFYGIAALPGLLFLLLSLLAWQRREEGGGLKWAAMAGLLAGWTGFFRQDFGLFLMLSFSLAFAVRAAAARRADGKGFLLFWACALGCALAAYAPCLIAGKPAEIWDTLVLFGPRHQYRYYSKPLPALWPPLPWREWSGFYFPAAVAGAFLVRSLFRLKPAEGREAREGGLLRLGLAGALLFSHALGRADMVHFFPALVPAWILASAALAASPRRRLSWAAGALLACGFLALPLRQWGRELPRLFRRQAVLSPRAQGLLPYGDLDAASAWVALNTQPGSKIYVANSDTINPDGNDMLFYFLADRECASRYVTIHRAQYWDPAVVNEVKAALAAPTTSAVVIVSFNSPVPGDSELDRLGRAFGHTAYKIGFYEVRVR